MALLANQIMDARILSSMNGRAELSQFLRVTNQSIISQVNSTQEDSRKNRKYPCPLCGKRFRFNSILSLHMRTHTGEKPFKCPYCDHRAAQKGNLKIHLRTHKQGILGKGRGRIREENRLLHELEERAILRDRQTRNGLSSQPQPSSVSQLRKPQLSQTVHPQPLFFTTCVAESQPQSTASPQATSAPDDPAQPQTSGFRCSFCKGKFRKQQELERHIRILHKPYKCTLCEFAASHEEELIGHVEMAHITADSGSGQKAAAAAGPGDKRKPVGEFPCEVCGQTFSQAWFLKGHMRKHKDSFEHCCQICGRRFKEPWFLKNHMKVHLNKLAAKHHLPSEHDAPDKMGRLAPERHGGLFPQYVSNLHGRFAAAERAEHQDYSQMLAAAGVDMKVREMLGRMISSGAGLLTDAESGSLAALNHVHSQPTSASMEYLQKLVSSRETLNSYPGWQVMASGFPAEQQMFPAKEQQQQQQQAATPYPSDRCSDEARVGLGDPDAKPSSGTSSPGGAGLQEPVDIGGEMGDSCSGSTLGGGPPSSPTASGEKDFRCPPSSTAQRALGFYQDDFPFARWPTGRDLSSPLQPANSSSSPKPKLPPASREGWSPAAAPYLGLEGLEGLEGLGDSALLLTKQPVLTDGGADADGPSSSQTRKSQFEPLDLSVRPESVLSPAVLVQMAGIFRNGLSSSITQQLQSYSKAAGELGVKPNYQSDLLAQGTRENKSSQQHADGGDGAYEKGERVVEGDGCDAADWKMLKNEVEPEEAFQGPWGRGVSESPISSLENLTPGQAEQHQHQAGLLSFLRSPGSLGSTSANPHRASVNGGGGLEKDGSSARKPFQCRYCPYSASQKGNLKTHVLCVHRKPFDNSLYPDRRLRRSHAPHTPSRVPQSIAGDDRATGRDRIGMTSLCET